ncbi:MULTISPECIES: UDP-N-acetylmuramoyl-L-alanyl-D-glutamate--2,6-diaminopimelate ligase [Petrimonas]|jgi:UDP-N-acetylmuramoyl-L-alanyl-D-glutamate--2,6-diaminopimelate ligase|uniref:UDP-N-acetylmuramoyl-L-alanyl-D-glutamate--2,6-diaminopimelate ligase n=1 Tax=Petrimonas mucosa TaxID=1642646 RepID=A0A1G4GA25_9BACT|nr:MULTISPECIES: UDP-N-acetylmuramoyl-L-alanyl-D-glutamate--2,6-diaminopimelate ligase [Petrimonas]MDD3559879.1 UDP-N-acetylmuramoyl-L-alanyl-D-glutamate--2,6-diaminopimelate ligase [Petrimonas mucosa]SCM59377.1 UDP-N-acetylmuramoyl-L-alanyl-D-glutamate-2, 6-diaminopimelate ligase {ECO:0000255/HAMAP-Rule:MF_00208} [Petrimonas mucosa]SFU51274.1 UDP-N-acetylmuramoylalanyl-D-glutamate--2,6-diaminopimelate ligase [Porphyromonadaceae bacterium KHP3R9]HHT29973.1 UDP-N-acetylmuramoyl-L-alanyl-D-glutam
MRLSQLLEKCKIVAIHGEENVEVENITSDSRQVQKGSLFIAVEGINTDGHDYIGKAIEQDVQVVVYDKPMFEEYFSRVTYVQVENSAIALAQIASAWFGNPSEHLKLVGVTGTNGKTTVATLLHRTFRTLGYGAGLLSTVANYVNDDSFPTTHTTLDPITLNAFLRKMVDAGCQYAFMEVSSHAIHQKRVYGLRFEGGVFTNLTQDHLDYHKNMLEYRNVKKAFFDSLPESAFAITNSDDKNGAVMLQNSVARKYTYSVKGMGDFKARIFEKHFDGTEIEINGKELIVQFVGVFNVYNLLAVYGTAVLLGQQPDELLRILTLLKPVAGRFQTLRSPAGFTAIVDYAHTPDALTNVLNAINEVLEQRGDIITVVGCGGNRDKTKRPLMAREAVELSNKVILTSDNPRFEEPQDIIDDMVAGLDDEQRRTTLSIVDRREAIKTACALAKPGDVILVAGKGHEDYQEIKGVKHHFDDKEELEKIFHGLLPNTLNS